LSYNTYKLNIYNKSYNILYNFLVHRQRPRPQTFLTCKARSQLVIISVILAYSRATMRVHIIDTFSSDVRHIRGKCVRTRTVHVCLDTHELSVSVRQTCFQGVLPLLLCDLRLAVLLSCCSLWASLLFRTPHSPLFRARYVYEYICHLSACHHT